MVRLRGQRPIGASKKTPTRRLILPVVRGAKVRGRVSGKRRRQQWVDGANCRLLVAVKALAQARKLAVPVLRANIAKKRVNLAAPTAVVADAPG